jgi:hypothetical protein
MTRLLQPRRRSLKMILSKSVPMCQAQNYNPLLRRVTCVLSPNRPTNPRLPPRANHLTVLPDYEALTTILHELDCMMLWTFSRYNPFTICRLHKIAGCPSFGCLVGCRIARLAACNIMDAKEMQYICRRSGGAGVRPPRCPAKSATGLAGRIF